MISWAAEFRQVEDNSFELQAIKDIWNIKLLTIWMTISPLKVFSWRCAQAPPLMSSVTSLPLQNVYILNLPPQPWRHFLSSSYLLSFRHRYLSRSAHHSKPSFIFIPKCRTDFGKYVFSAFQFLLCDISTELWSSLSFPYLPLKPV